MYNCEKCQLIKHLTFHCSNLFDELTSYVVLSNPFVSVASTTEILEKQFLCHLRSIAAHRDHGVCPSICLSGSHTFLVVRHCYVSQATHIFLGMLPLYVHIYYAPFKEGGAYCVAHVHLSVSLNLVQLITQERFAPQASNLVRR